MLPKARPVLGQRDEQQVAAALQAELPQPGVLAVEGPEAMGVGDAGGEAIRLVLPAVVLAAQARTVAPLLVCQQGMPVGANVLEGVVFTTAIAYQDRLAEQVQRQEIPVPGQLRTRPDQVPGGHEQPLDLPAILCLRPIVFRL